MTILTENEVKAAYSGQEAAAGYVGKRFTGELNLLLHDRQVAAVQAVMDRIGAGKVLEIAPGPGRLTQHLRPRGLLVCLEYNQGMLEQCKQTCGDRAALLCGDGFRLPFAACFDLVFTFRFIRHFQEADRQRLYAEVRRVLRPGGCFLMDAVNERVSRTLGEGREDQWIYDKWYQAAELRKELAGAGLEPMRLEPVHKLYRWQWLSQVWLGPRANWLNRLLIRGLEGLPCRDGREWIVTCRRE